MKQGKEYVNDGEVKMGKENGREDQGRGRDRKEDEGGIEGNKGS